MSDASTDEMTSEEYPLEFGPVTRRIWGFVVVGLTAVIVGLWLWSLSWTTPPWLLETLVLLASAVVLAGIVIGAVVELWKWAARVRAGRRPPFPLAVTLIFLLVAVLVVAFVGNVPARVRFEPHRSALDEARDVALEMIERHPDGQAASFHVDGVGVVHASAVPGGVMFITEPQTHSGYVWLDNDAAGSLEGLRPLGGGWYLDQGARVS